MLHPYPASGPTSAAPTSMHGPVFRPAEAASADGRASHLRRLLLCVGLAIAACSAAPALAQERAITDSAIVSAGGTVSADRFRLTSTIGEAIAGPVSAGSVRVVGGFLAKFGDTAADGGQIFRDGFETTPYTPTNKHQSYRLGGATQ
jgi:hypothetical protein